MNNPPCPECGSAVRLVDSRVAASGQRRRRYHCLHCLHRWSELGDNTPVRPPYELIADIRGSDEPEAVLARRHGCSTSTVGAIRRGEVWADVVDDGPSCRHCLHWHHGCCSLGFPDPREEGVAFARWCVTFEQVAA